VTRALLLDCDGVLADTERDGHLVAFNAMFAELDLPIRWTDREYARLVRIGGGKERLAAAVTPALAARLGLPDDAAGRAEVIAGWHRVKTRHYAELVRAGALPARPGVRRLVAEVLAAGWRVAVASTSAHESVTAVLSHTVGPHLAARIPVFAGDVVARKKPAPDIYLRALDALGVLASDAVAVEDSGSGLAAALAARLRTVVTTSAYSGDDDFSGAAVVLSDLGEPARPAAVRSDADGVCPPGVVTLQTLERLLARL
jgi:HAD superfamily hydrolase (TIGR01509 family)